MTSSNGKTGGLSDSAKVALVVIVFGVLSVVLALLGNGGGVPESLNIEATNTVRTLVAEAALAPPAPVRWTFYELGRRKPVHDLLWQEGALWVASVDGLLRLTDEGEFEPLPGFPEDAEPLRLWRAEDGTVVAGLADGRTVSLQAGAWQPPQALNGEFPSLLRAEAAPGDYCTAQGTLSGTEGGLWVACPESIVHVFDGTAHRYTGVDGLPDDPTGPLQIGPDGRLWIGLDTGVAALEELPE